MSDHDDLREVYRELESLTSSLPKKPFNNSSNKNGLAPVTTNGLLSSKNHHMSSSHEGANSSHNNSTPTKKSGLWFFGTERLSWDNSLVASYNPDTKMFRCVKCDTIGFISRIAEHYLGTHANAKVFQCPQCPYSSAWSRCVRMHLIKNHGIHDAPNSLWKGQPLLDEIVQLMQNLKSSIEAQQTNKKPSSENATTDKRHSCPKCPYSTDRRDLYIRHENIHREDKPFHCYFCFKVFNRADHVKKHFLRIHRGYPYDISRIRRYPPKKLNPNVTTWNSVNGSSLENGHHPRLSHSPLVNNYLAPPPPSCATSPPQQNNTIHRHLPFTPIPRPLPSYTNEVINLTTTKPTIIKPEIIKAEITKPINGEAIPLNKFAISALLELINKPNSSSTLVEDDASKSKDTSGKEEEEETTKDKIKSTSSCPYCPWVGTDSWCLRRHMNSHIRPFHCPQCDYRAARAERLSIHMWKAHQRHACQRCGYIASHEQDLKDHMKLIHGSNRGASSGSGGGGVASCGFCKTPVGLSQEDLEIHLLMVHGLSLLHCPETGCHFSTSQISLLEAHRQHKHLDLQQLTGPLGELSTTICQECGCEFADFGSLANHVHLAHGEEVDPFRCVLCGFMCLRQRSMMEHMALHSGQLLRCKVGNGCGFLTAHPAALRAHLGAAHQEEDGCVSRCPHCGQACSSLPALMDHRRRHHHPTEPCPFCRRAERRYFSQTSRVPDSSSSFFARSRKQPHPKRLADHLQSQKNSCSSTKEDVINRVTKLPITSSSSVPSKGSGKTSSSPSHFICKLCCDWPIAYRFKKNLIVHHLWQHRHSHSCKVCNARFPQRYQVMLHHRNTHKDNESNSKKS